MTLPKLADGFPSSDGPALKIYNPDADARPGKSTKEADPREERQRLQREREFDAAIATCRSLYRNSLISDRTRVEYDKMWEGLRKERDGVRMMRENVQFLNKTIMEAREYRGEFHAMLERGESQGWIGKASKQRWLNRFYQQNTLEWVRKAWLKEHFFAYAERWQAVGKKREDVLALAKKHKLTSRKIPLLAKLEDKEGFLNKSYYDRVQLASQAHAAILAAEQKEGRLYRDAQKYLRSLTTGPGRTLHPKKVGRWLERLFSSDDPQNFFKEVIVPYSREWAALRGEYDEVAAEMKGKGVPRGFWKASVDDFLWMHRDQRASYLEQARHAMALQERAQEHKEEKLDGFKLAVRHDLDIKDWEGAEDSIATGLRAFPQDPELLSMQRYLASHRTDKGKGKEKQENKQETADIARTKQEMWEHLRNMPTSMQKLAIKVLQHPDPKAFRRFRQMIYNRAWCRAHGFLNDEREQAQSQNEENKELTRHRQEYGHTTGYEVQHVDGDTATKQAIRSKNRKPQVVYADATGIDSMASVIVRERDNEWFGYWTTLILRDVDFTKHNEVLQNNLFPLMQAKRKLAAAGEEFTIPEAHKAAA